MILSSKATGKAMGLGHIYVEVVGSIVRDHESFRVYVLEVRRLFYCSFFFFLKKRVKGNKREKKSAEC